MNFYKRFIKDYLKITILLINLIKITLFKDNNLRLSIIFLLILEGLKDKAFIILKNIFIKTSILTHFNLNKKI